MKTFFPPHTRTPRVLTLAVALQTAAPVWAQNQDGGAVTEPILDLPGTGPMVLTLFKVLGSLVLVVGLMVLFAVWLKKMGLARGGLQQGSLIQVIDTKMIAPKKYIAVVQVAEERLALGITDQQITLLTPLAEGDPPPAPPAGQDAEHPPFPSLLRKAAQAVRTKG